MAQNFQAIFTYEGGPGHLYLVQMTHILASQPA